MAHLSISLLGAFQVCHDGQPVTEFDSNKARGLLAYLAVEADRPHAREALSALLWPDWPQDSATNSLRNALAGLRRAIHDQEADPPYLLITREDIQFNVHSDVWVDVAEFERSAISYQRSAFSG
jgi:DNA-binding SARP family transcriptional activator